MPLSGYVLLAVDFDQIYASKARAVESSIRAAVMAASMALGMRSQKQLSLLNQDTSFSSAISC